MATVAEWVGLLDLLYPFAWAEEGDSSGLQVGDRSWPVERVLVALDPTRGVVEEAGARGAALVVTHHPLVFRPLARLDLGEEPGATVGAAIRLGVAVVACHTNADVASPGVSDVLGDVVGLTGTRPLLATGAGQRVKLVTFVPPEATPKVLEAIAAAGAGVIGGYDTCSFRVRGTGTFRPSPAAHPAVGEVGRLNEVEEDRLEALVPRERLGAVVAALLDAHPYEEVAHDVYPLEGPGGLGVGRVGELAEPVPAGVLAARCEEALGSRPRLVGDPGKEVRRVAVCGGSGGGLVGEAIRAGADAYVTGDLTHHQALEAVGAGLAVVDAGHHATEWPFVRHLAERLRREGPAAEVLVGETVTDPFLA